MEGAQNPVPSPSQTTTRACSGKCSPPRPSAPGTHCGRLATVLEEVRVLSLHMVLVQIHLQPTCQEQGGESGHSAILPWAAVWRASRGGAHGRKGDGKSSAWFCLFIPPPPVFFCFSVLYTPWKTLGVC
uniref:Uncharacterized protein n=1 Tax=Micrurus lemniscatus lemniscatus TaxID=129467 RepID=A0A2D4HQE4_MICLE